MMMPTSETILINGEREAYQTQTAQQLIAARGIDPERPGVAIAINGVVIRRVEWESTSIEPGDRVEIIRATAGG